MIKLSDAQTAEQEYEGIKDLFGEGFASRIIDSQDALDEGFREEVVCGERFLIRLAETDRNSERKSLFATYLWNGSRVLANFLFEELRSTSQSSSVIEFGSGAGLPSMACYRLGAKLVCVTDYPSPCVITNLTINISKNCLKAGLDSMAIVIPYKWADDVTPLLIANNQNQYDVAIASECLWRHEEVRYGWGKNNNLFDRLI